MKPIYRLLLVILLILVILLAPQLFEEKGETVTNTLKLVDINKFGGTMAVFRDSNDAEVYFLDLTDAVLTDENGDNISIQALSPGMIVEVTWNGQVQHSSPAGITADTVQVVEQADDLVGLYLTALTSLWETNSSLVNGAEQLNFDLSALTHLTAAEQTALAYLCSCSTSFLPYDLTVWDEATADSSVCFSVTPEGAPDSGAFSFTIEMSRGSGAAVPTDFTASRGENGQWSCTALS